MCKSHGSVALILGRLWMQEQQAAVTETTDDVQGWSE